MNKLYASGCAATRLVFLRFPRVLATVISAIIELRTTAAEGEAQAESRDLEMNLAPARSRLDGSRGRGQDLVGRVPTRFGPAPARSGGFSANMCKIGTASVATSCG